MAKFDRGRFLGSAALLAGVLICNTPAAHAGSPSFDCAKADSRAEQLICGDKELAIMDVEATRVFRLVRDRNGMADNQRKALNDDRARWTKVRDECWIAEDFRSCILSAYAVRIHSLRENHSDVLAGDDKGITRGPVALTCDKLGDTVRATFIRSDPPVSAVQFRKRVHVGIGSGPRYIEKSASGELAFWTKGDLAYLTTPDGVNYSCTVEKTK